MVERRRVRVHGEVEMEAVESGEIDRPTGGGRAEVLRGRGGHDVLVLVRRQDAAQEVSEPVVRRLQEVVRVAPETPTGSPLGHPRGRRRAHRHVHVHVHVEAAGGGHGVRGIAGGHGDDGGRGHQAGVLDEAEAAVMRGRFQIHNSGAGWCSSSLNYFNGLYIWFPFSTPQWGDLIYRLLGVFSEILLICRNVTHTI